MRRWIFRTSACPSTRSAKAPLIEASVRALSSRASSPAPACASNQVDTSAQCHSGLRTLPATGEGNPRCPDRHSRASRSTGGCVRYGLRCPPLTRARPRPIQVRIPGRPGRPASPGPLEATMTAKPGSATSLRSLEAALGAGFGSHMAASGAPRHSATLSRGRLSRRLPRGCNGEPLRMSCLPSLRSPSGGDGT